MATEFAYWAKPNVPGQHWESMGGSCTKLVKAKYAARVLAMHAGMGIPAYWNETIEFAFRPTSNGGLQGPYQPEPIYYVLRTLCTIFDGIKPASMPVELIPCEPEPAKVVDDLPYYAIPSGEPAQPIVYYSFKMPDGGSMIILWYDGPGSDDFSPVVVDCKLPFNAKSVIAVDVLNGVTQKLISENNGDNLIIKGMKVAYYPVIVELH
jgi:hypothetical protein